jgi:hypothetical protein
MIEHDIRARLHATRLQLTFLERAVRSPDHDPEIVDAVNAASGELKQLEQLVLAHLAASTSGEAS